MGVGRDGWCVCVCWGRGHMACTNASTHIYTWGHACTDQTNAHTHACTYPIKWLINNTCHMHLTTHMHGKSPSMPTRPADDTLALHAYT